MRAVLALAVVLGAASQSAPSRTAPPPVFIDAIAVDVRGRFVDDLQLEDFEIFEGDTPRRADAVRLVTADGAREPDETVQPIDSPAAERFQAAREGARLFAIFLDEYHVAAGEGISRARDLLVDFVQRALGPRDLIVLVKPLDSLVSLRMTRDRDAVIGAIASFDGRKGDYEPRSELEKSLFAGTAGPIEAVRDQIAISALNALATHLGGLSVTRKTIVLVSEGFAVGPGRRRDGLLPTVAGVIQAANRANVAIYPVDPRALTGANVVSAEGLAADRPTENAGREMLVALANETDGHAILAADDLRPGLERIVRDSSAYYLLTLPRAPGDNDGKFHPVQVRVKRPQIQVRARKGYWAAWPDDLFRASPTATITEPTPSELARRASPLIRPWFGLARGSDGDTRVSFVWEPVGRVPGERTRVQAPARVMLKATRADGTTVYEGVARPSGLIAAPEAMPSQLVFDAPPGRLRIQMSIEDAESHVLDTDVRDVLVKSLAGPMVLGSAAVLRSRTAREYRMLQVNPDAAPVAAREFSRGERLLIRLSVYAADDRVRLSARLMTGLGGSMRDLAVAPASRPDLYQIDLPLAGLPVGEYIVEIEATSSGGDAKERLAFRVRP